MQWHCTEYIDSHRFVYQQSGHVNVHISTPMDCIQNHGEKIESGKKVTVGSNSTLNPILVPQTQELAAEVDVWRLTCQL